MQITYRQEILRKLIHLSSLWMVVAIYLLPRPVAALLFFVLCAGTIFVEYGTYQNWPVFAPLYRKFFGKMLRAKETTPGFHMSGAPYVLAAAFLVSLLFYKEVAMFALTVMLIGDTAAALIGRKWGVHPINHKSVEGSAAFFLSGLAVLGLYTAFFGWTVPLFWGGLSGVVLATFAELYENKLHIDDNFSIPLICGICLSAVI